MRGINKAIILGYVGQDPQIISKNDFITAKFSIATSFFVKNKETGMNEAQTEWHRIVAFGKLAQIIQTYIKKGSQIYIEGVLKTTKYTDKEGILRYSTEIIANQMQMLGKRETEVADETQHFTPSTTDIFNDDIPF
jgi:single-strand DNA-binding protein